MEPAPTLFKRILAASRYVTFIAACGALLGSAALVVYETVVIIAAAVNAFANGNISPDVGKALAVGLISALDIFLIAIVAMIIGLGLYVLFIDGTLPLPTWLKIENLDDLKGHLVSTVIAVLAVLFMREAFEWDGERDLLGFGAAVALIIAVLALHLKVKR